ncbi:endonuclease [Flavobacterium paronense]|uniref:Endonuclease n=1 Tax=Flavobacterium paronense TaxID=1392775 RepID=A0ABV5GC59_9FLAO|nr:endonuclease [Flavobacterium paronense]MDN3677819.1 endonuclease [Flavobacterium paronense]
MFKKIMLLLAFLAFSVSNAQIVINELDSDTPSTNDKQFIELKSTVANLSLNGYVLVFFNGTGTLATKSYYVIDLDGLTTDVNGIIVLGNQLVSPVPTKLLTDSTFQNGPDGVAIYLGNATDFPNNTIATTTNLIDALVYDTSDVDATALMTALGVISQIDENANGAQTTQSIQRKNDGTYETKAPTPGANNDGSGFVFNGITISTSTAVAGQVTEGSSMNIIFTTQTPITSALNFTFSINTGTINNADYTGSTSVAMVAGTSSYTATINFVDDVLDEGDETAIIKFGTLPSVYCRINDFIEIRVIDNDFVVSPWGTPLNPTYGIVTPTIPIGYYDSLEGKSGATLKQAIQDIIANPSVVHAHNYGDVETILKKADQNPLNSNQVWLMYVEQPRSKLDIQETGINTGKWNREHIYPQSRGGYSDGTSSIPDGINVWLPTNANDIMAGHGDAHHIRAEDGPENSIRNNKDYGEYLGPTGTQGSWHGDVARALFYMACRYNGLSVVNGNPANSTVGQLGDLALLLQWNHADPKDDFEMNRNNYIYTWQVNRNPFIDYPDLADYVFGANFGQTWFAPLSNTTFDAARVVLYPNPTKGNVTIFGITTDAKVEMFSTLGQKVYEQNFSGETSINLNLAPGIYLAKITANSKTVFKKIVVE